MSEMATIQSGQQSIELEFGESFDPGIGFITFTLSEGVWNFTADFDSDTPTDSISVNIVVDNTSSPVSAFLTQDTSLEFEVLEGGATVEIISYDSVPIKLTPIDPMPLPPGETDVVSEPVPTTDPEPVTPLPEPVPDAEPVAPDPSNPPVSEAESFITFALVNAETNEIAAGYENLGVNGEIDLSDIDFDQFNLIAQINENHPQAAAVKSIKFESNLGDRTENVAPYALFGDKSGDFFGQALAAGEFTVKATAYTGKRGTGEEIGTTDLTYTVLNSSAPATVETDSATADSGVPSTDDTGNDTGDDAGTLTPDVGDASTEDTDTAAMGDAGTPSTDTDGATTGTDPLATDADGTSTPSTVSPGPLPQPAPTIPAGKDIFLTQNGQLVMEAESATPTGHWRSTNVAGETVLLWDADRSSYGKVPTGQTLSYQFATDEAGTYDVALRSGRVKAVMNESDRFSNGQERTDTGNDIYFSIVNAETGNVVQAPTKLYTNLGKSDSVLRWGTTFDVKHQKSAAAVELEADTRYQLEISGRSDGYMFDRITLSNDGVWKNANAPESATQSDDGLTGGAAEAGVLEDSDMGLTAPPAAELMTADMELAVPDLMGSNTAPNTQTEANPFGDSLAVDTQSPLSGVETLPNSSTV